MGNSPATTAGKNPRENTVYTVCICVCVCVYIYIHTHTHTHIHTVYVCVYIYIYIYIYIYTQYIWSNVVDALQLHGGLNYSFALQHHNGQTTLLHILYI